MRLIILDRDGVINHDSDQYIKSLSQWRPLPGSIEAIARLSQAEFRVTVATNQSGLERGLFDLQSLHEIHAHMNTLVNQAGGHIDAILFCPYQNDRHACRKPNPGMYLEIADRLGIPLEEVPVVGDSYRDVLAAYACGASPILVRTGKGQRTLLEHPHLIEKIPVLDDLASAVDHILAKDET